MICDKCKKETVVLHYDCKTKEFLCGNCYGPEMPSVNSVNSGVVKHLSNGKKLSHADYKYYTNHYVDKEGRISARNKRWLPSSSRQYLGRRINGGE